MKYPFVRAPNWSSHVIGSFALFTVCGEIGKSCKGRREEVGERVWTELSHFIHFMNCRRAVTYLRVVGDTNTESRCFQLVNIELGKNRSPQCGAQYLLLLLVCSATLIKTLICIYLKQDCNRKSSRNFSCLKLELGSENKWVKIHKVVFL